MCLHCARVRFWMNRSAKGGCGMNAPQAHNNTVASFTRVAFEILHLHATLDSFADEVNREWRGFGRPFGSTHGEFIARRIGCTNGRAHRPANVVRAPRGLASARCYLATVDSWKEPRPEARTGPSGHRPLPRRNFGRGSRALGVGLPPPAQTKSRLGAGPSALCCLWWYPLLDFPVDACAPTGAVTCPDEVGTGVSSPASTLAST